MTSTTTASRQMPKEEIGASRFLRDHPQFDGCGVVLWNKLVVGRKGCACSVAT